MRVKKPCPAFPSPSHIDEVRSELERWRRGHSYRARIPDAIWTAATTLARTHGAGRIARLLRLDYYALRRRVGQAHPAVPEGPGVSPAFVELRPTAMAAPMATCVVEGARRDGGRLRIECTGPQLPDLAGLSASFWDGTA